MLSSLFAKFHLFLCLTSVIAITLGLIPSELTKIFSLFNLLGNPSALVYRISKLSISNIASFEVSLTVGFSPWPVFVGGGGHVYD